MTTTIAIRDDQWKELNSRKEPGESFKDVIGRLLSDESSERRETGESPAERPAVESPDESLAAVDAGHTVESAMELVDLPGQGDKLERRRAAFRALLEKLRDQPGATDELYGPTFEAHDVEYASVESWRSNAAGTALSQLAERGVVECTDESAGEWRWNP